MEYFKHGDLAALIHSSEGLGEEDAKEIVEQILEVWKYSVRIAGFFDC